ncbi:hypothetical protein PB01_17185 [Psychrobacillus glaciei]|uniref:Uncharacterized protein n=1 Tax=Psychrobacillus glaciei TaxID=2283160 RepID=A0A5J6SVR3_9BACI|nr:hypothetical protein [Psychrobacillus glaciei]QFG00398.1 hypothetical protein PB01_17185 [Psychrobacillus glaciei]
MFIWRTEYEKAVQVLGDTVYVETLIMKNEALSEEEKIKKIKAFNQLYPTNETRFDLAFYEEDYKLMMNLPSISASQAMR